MELVGLVVACGLVTTPLLGYGVHEHWSTVGLGEFECLEQCRYVMAVDGSEVLYVEIGIQRLVVREAGQEPVGAATDAAEHRATHRTEHAEEPVGLAVQVLVGRRRAHAVEIAGHAADRRSVGAPVVVDDDHEIAVVVVGDVVQCLPRHPARESAVTHDGHDMTIRPSGGRQGPGDAVRPAQRAGRVGGLHDVVRALTALRVAGEPTTHAKSREVLPAREQLVDVRLMTGVEDDRISGRFEDAVQRDREFDDTEVGTQMAARSRDVLDEELSGLCGELHEFVGGEVIEISWSADALQNRHPPSSSFREQCRSAGRFHPSILSSQSENLRLTRLRGASAPGMPGGPGRCAPGPSCAIDQTSERSTYCRMPPLR